MRLLPSLCLFLLLTACGDASEKSQAPAEAPVRVATVEKGMVNRSFTAVGNVEPSVSVAITPRVDGEILDIHFTEGDLVVQGQPLIQIDPRPYAAVLAEKKANLAKSQAQLSKARHDRMRYGKLAANGYISQEAYEQATTDAAAIAATVEADKAAVDKAALDLSYCTISAPVSGRIGELKLHKGNMVKNNDSGPIATIDTIAPCYVSFTVPEIYLPAIISQARGKNLAITALPVGGEPAEGIMTLVDNRVDTKTGSIKLRATFQNDPQTLWPGQFVEVQLPLGEKTESILVPTRAVQKGQEETYLYVVDDNGKASYRAIRPLFETGALTAVAGDVRPGDKVVIEGQIRLAPNAPVRVIDSDSETPASPGA